MDFKKCLLALIAAFGFCTDDVFDEIPSFFDGINVAVGVQTIYPHSVAEFRFTDDLFANAARPGQLLLSGYLGLFSTESVSNKGFLIAAGSTLADGDLMMLSSTITGANNAKKFESTISEWYVSAHGRNGVLVNPATLIYGQLGAGITSYEIETDHVVTVSVPLIDRERYFYLDASVGIEAAAIEEWGLQVDLSARYFSERILSVGHQAVIRDANVAATELSKYEFPQVELGAALRLVYHDMTN